MTDLDGVKLDDAMSFFSTNVDSWGAAEWFDRLARAIQAQNAAVVAGDEVGFDTYRMIASSSAMRLVSDYEAEVRRALSPTPEAPTPIAFLKDVGGWGSDGEGYDECFVVAAKGDPGAFAVYATPRSTGVRVTDEMVERVTAAVKRYTQATLFVDELREVVRSALASHTPAIGETQPGLSATDETRAFPKTLGRIHEAIDGYVSALVAREHGGVAQDRAFTAICQALGRSPAEELGFRIRALANPGDGE